MPNSLKQAGAKALERTSQFDFVNALSEIRARGEGSADWLERKRQVGRLPSCRSMGSEVAPTWRHRFGRLALFALVRHESR
jgi:hypothetical protein